MDRPYARQKSKFFQGTLFIYGMVAGILFFGGAGRSLADAPSLGGSVELDHISYDSNPNDAQVNSRNQSTLQLEISGTAEEARYHAAGRMRTDDSDPAQDRSYLYEGYVDLAKGNWDLRVGKQIIAWGKADAFNPTDNVTPFDYSDIIDTEDERLGVLALKVGYFMDEVMIEGIVQPTFTPNAFATPTSRWFPGVPTRINAPSGTGELELTVNPLDEVRPDESDIGKFAGKISWSGAGWDVSASYLQGWAHTPAIAESLEQTGPDTATLALQNLYYRHRVIGMDFSTAFGKYGLRGEAAHFIPETKGGSEDAIGDPYTQFSFGIDRTFSGLVGENDLYVLMEAMGDTTDRSDTIIGDYLVHPFRRAAAAKIEYRIGYLATWSVEGIYDFHGDGFYLKPKVFYAFSDAVELEAWLDILAGGDESLFGQFKENDRFQVRLKYSF